MTYIDYKKEIEFDIHDYMVIDNKVPRRWFVSVWDKPSVEFVSAYFPNSPYIKVPSPHITNYDLIERCVQTFIPLILSTGMSTEFEIDFAYGYLLNYSFTMLACTSSYPCWDEDVHLNKISLLKNRYGNKRKFDHITKIGYSNHSPSTFPAIYSSLLGAEMIEIHVTLNRAMPGSDHSASLEMRGVEIVLRELKRHPDLMGPNELTVFDSELSKKESLRG